MEKENLSTVSGGFILACIGSDGRLWEISGCFHPRLPERRWLVPDRTLVFVALIGSRVSSGKCAWDAAPAPVQSGRVGANACEDTRQGANGVDALGFIRQPVPSRWR